MRGAKSVNSKLFKDFCNEAEMEKNSQIGGFYFIIVPKQGEGTMFNGSISVNLPNYLLSVILLFRGYALFFFLYY